MTLANKTDKRIEISWDSVPYGIDPDCTLDADGVVGDRLVAAGAIVAPVAPIKKGKKE